MWASPPSGRSALSSTPGISRTPIAAAARDASATPAVVSWSVSAMWRTPFAPARRISAAGVSTPSD